MQNLKIVTTQFENPSGDKAYNLEVIEKLATQAAQQGGRALGLASRTLPNKK